MSEDRFRHHQAAIERLYSGHTRALVFRGDAISEAVNDVQVVLPGTFNPLHEGHCRMARIAENILAAPITFELSIRNVDKPPVEMDSLLERLTEFDNDASICLTQAATFVEKSMILKNTHFIVGADTIVRIADGQYYDRDDAKRDSAIDQLRQRGARFLVFGRAMTDRFRTLSELDLPDSLRAICREVSEAEFRCDISSTHLRRTNSTNR